MTRRTNRFSVLELEQEEFLAGPERYALYLEGLLDEDLLRIDDGFEKSVDDILLDHPVALGTLHSVTCSLSRPGFRFAEHPHGVVMLSNHGTVAGAYLGPDVAVAPNFRGLGLGTELIVERALRDDALPGWDLDEPCYTPGGENAHRAAWQLLADPVFSSRKIDAINVAHETLVPALSSLRRTSAKFSKRL